LSGKKERKLKIVDHRHCKVCGKAIPPGQEFCSERCRKIYEETQRREKRMKNIFLLIYAVIFIVLFLLLASRAGIH